MFKKVLRPFDIVVLVIYIIIYDILHVTLACLAALREPREVTFPTDQTSHSLLVHWKSPDCTLTAHIDHFELTYCQQRVDQSCASEAGQCGVAEMGR